MIPALRALAGRYWKLLRPYILIAAVVLPLRSSVIDWNWVPTGSMVPTIVPLEGVLVNKAAYGLRVPFTFTYAVRWDEPQRGDVVVFISPADGERLVKRVVGLPGDVVEMRDERVFVNGSPLAYQAAPDAATLHGLVRPDTVSLFTLEELDGRPHRMMIQPLRPAVRSFGPVTVPDGEFLVLGDNRDNSNDSRFIGTIERKRIVGRASAVIASVDQSRWGLPRPGRFFTAIR